VTDSSTMASQNTYNSFPPTIHPALFPHPSRLSNSYKQLEDKSYSARPAHATFLAACHSSDYLIGKFISTLSSCAARKENPNQYIALPSPYLTSTYLPLYATSMSLVDQIEPQVRLLFIPDFGD
jgi:hypothetical protein